MPELSADIKQQIQEGYRQFLARDNLKPRLGQRQMIATIANSLAAIEEDDEGNRCEEQRETDTGICVIEAGTGTGKTLAYLLSVLPLAQQRNKQVVIATGTVALQEQLLNKDIPALLASTGWNYSFMIAKGRGRYLCPLRLDQCLNTVAAQDGGQFLFDDEVIFNTDKRVVKQYQKMAEALEKGEWDGDRDHWQTVIPDVDWQPLTIDRRRCAGRHCRFIRECCFFNAREKVEETDCLIVNHDLLMADLALGGGAILPAPQQTLYIIDEAHRLADKAISHFTANVRSEGSLNSLQKMQRQLEGVIQQSQQEIALAEQLVRLEEPVAQVIAALSLIQPQLKGLLETGNGIRERYRFPAGDIGAELREQAVNIAAAFSLLVTRLQAVTEQLQSALSSPHPAIPLVDLENMLQLVGTWQNRTEGALQLWQYYAQPLSDSGPPVARWLALEDSVAGNPDIQLFAAPTHGGNILRERLFDNCYGAVLTSATLRMLNSFAEFLKRSGLKESCTCQTVAGAFDYMTAGELVVPDIGADGGDPVAHTQALIAQLPPLFDVTRGTLVLFSSRRQMEEVYNGVCNDFSGRILVQNELPLNKLLNRHKEAVDAGTGSVIFGLASFAEGIDLPGDYCVHVIIAKLPFAVPDDPVSATLSDWLESAGGNAFMQLSLPEASLRLNQSCGRLLRTEQDTGRVTILDRRIVTKRYGKSLLNALPPFRRVF